MGEIKEGKVSGLIPRNEGFAVHYPSYPSSTSRAIQTLGGTESILKARSSQSNTLELYFRPEDPYSHPVSGELRSCHSMLLKITKKKKSSPINDAKQETDEFHADIVARIPEAYYFEGMADYQHVVPVHADVGRKRRKNCKKPGLMDLGPDDVMMLPPPLFSLKDMPENIVLRPPSTSSSRKKQDELPETHPKMTFEPALGIDFKDVEDILMLHGFHFMSGPFQKFWIRKGYDPRKDPDSRRYQSIGFRVPPELKSYCDANAAKGNQYSFQVYELDDDYIQQEIQKPSKQTSCIVRFLSLYPETGAEKFLKAASEKLMKSKRACIYKDAPKPVQEEHQQTNEEAVDDEASENQVDVEVDELESDDGEEELDTYGMDLAGEAASISLNFYSYMENTSTSYLQQLLNSFPSMDASVDRKQDGESSDGEYQIYKQDNDENDLDNDYDD